ncbi:MAG: hypothetical protein KF724_07990 [Phycisphaeraceae bacterium]|nr:hypothetical protein [Phycisphaeraceae bacterium]
MSQTRRIRMIAVAFAFALGVVGVHSSAIAQGAPARGTASPSEAPYSAAVNANNVFVRSSPSVSSSYPFHRLSSGDIVEVLEESYGWARVRCSGPAFAEAFGFVTADRRVELTDDGSTLRVTARTELKAPNINSRSGPDSSWKPVARLSPGETLRVLGTVEGDRDRAYKVALTPAAEGFVNLNYLRRASAAEVEAYRTGASARTQPAAATGTRASDAPERNASAPRRGEGAGAASIAEERRITSRPRGQAAAATDDAPAIGEIESDLVEERVAVQRPDGTEAIDVVAESTEVVTTRRAATPEPALSPREAESLAHRREFEDLESIWETVKNQPLESAEISVLRSRYADLQTRPNVPAEVRAMAKARTEQLGLRLEIQERMYTLERLRAQRTQDLDRIRAISLAMEARSDYDAVGVLNASTIFDGTRLPALYRLQDPAVGQTVAYVAPRSDFQLATMLGVLVGIRGERRYDPALRVTVIEPRTVDILTQRRSPQVIAPGSPEPTTVIIEQSFTPTPSTEGMTFAPVPPDAP